MLSQPIVRINAGGDTYTDISGNVWAKDANYTSGNTYGTNKPISGSSDPLLYQTERWGQQFSYNIPISSSGTYTVNLDFAEIFWSNPGQRVFDVNIEGASVIKNLDIVAQAGVNTALRKSVDVQVTDGLLNIDFLASVDNAKVSDIEVIPSSQPTLQATAQAVPIHLEAENMVLTNYQVESNSAASAGTVVSLSGTAAATGTATTTFNGAAGTYSVVVGYYDENDGVGNFAVNIGGKPIDAWNLNQNLGSNAATTQTFLRRTIVTALALNPGDLIEIKGTQNQGEYARVDYIDLIPANQTDSTPPPTPPGTPIRLEAENMALTNYYAESNSTASGGKVVSLLGAAATGTATTKFNGAAGTYSVVVGYYDENDGVGNFAVNIGGKPIDAWNLNQNLGSNAATTQTFLRRTIATGLVLNPGDLIEIKGTQNQGEYARFDYIEFLDSNQTDSTLPTASLSAANITTSGGTSQNLTVSYADNVGINVSTLDSQDIVVTGPNGIQPSVTFLSVNTNSNGTPRTATYQITAPGGSWDAADNGTYTVAVQANQVSDINNNYLQSGTLGTFTVNITSANPLTTPGIWDSAPKMPISLGEVSSGIINGIVYVVGEANSATLAYNLATGSWSNVAVRPYVGNHHAAEVFNGKLYLLGGLGGGADGKVQIYDPATNQWSLGANMPFAAGSSSSAVINGEIYVAGGIVGSSTTNQVAKYNPTTNTWTMLAPMKQGLNHSASGTDGSKLYVFGGRDGGNTVTNGYNTVEIYDPATNTWVSSLDAGSSLKPLPQARGGTGKAAYLNGEFYVMGGETLNGAGATSNNVYDRVDIYNPKTNTWRLGTPMPTPRHGIFPVVYGGEIWVAGGGLKAGYGNSNVFEAL
ncbi:MAG: malectin domain-containing carbohydrate-binding protein [Aulosira sp. ZfuVER01]|nr:malectin domain-containing carbohydrate-binding protein [Aulosira sp. ZfuVER01]MDZ7997317.1 malectin domain-containing carbohydrate-binding protein [Aulosira sp. DedVER01a]MDZ8055514.1 malectin domain-containing carbohydrate-binding protein [Aulosira sp. ZfuCHP01]